jgi:hypothetical protein
VNFNVNSAPTPGAAPTNTSTYVEPLVSMNDSAVMLSVIGPPPRPAAMGIQYMAVSYTGTYFNPFIPGCLWFNTQFPPTPSAAWLGSMWCGIPPPNQPTNPSFYGFVGLDSAHLPQWYTAQLDGVTKFTVSGCSAGTTVGGATSGRFTLGANTCTAIVTMNGATGLTAPNGWTCQAHDRTAPTILIGGESASTTTTASFTIPAGAGATDIISFNCKAF